MYDRSAPLYILTSFAVDSAYPILEGTSTPRRLAVKAMAARTHSQHNEFNGPIQTGGGSLVAGNTINAQGGNVYFDSMSSDISKERQEDSCCFKVKFGVRTQL